MSKLAERIRKVARVEAAPMGFGLAASHKPGPTMLLLARHPTDQADKAAEAVGRGADLVVLEGDPSRLKGTVPWRPGEVTAGVRLPDVDAEAVAQLKEIGIDFAIFDPEAGAADALLDEQFGFVLALGQQMTDVDLRVTESLNLDAILVPPLNGPLTVKRQLELTRLFLLSRTPLLLEVGPDVSAAQLRCLRDAGVVGVIVDGAAGRQLAELRQTIDGLPPPRRGRGREERAEAILPAAVAASAAEEEQEEDYP